MVTCCTSGLVGGGCCLVFVVLVLRSRATACEPWLRVVAIWLDGVGWGRGNSFQRQKNVVARSGQSREERKNKTPPLRLHPASAFTPISLHRVAHLRVRASGKSQMHGNGGRGCSYRASVCLEGCFGRGKRESVNNEKAKPKQTSILL